MSEGWLAVLLIGCALVLILGGMAWVCIDSARWEEEQHQRRRRTARDILREKDERRRR